MNKPTPGPWTFEASGFDGEHRRLKAAHGVTIGHVYAPQKAHEYRDLNAALIVSAINACFAVNPDNPMAVAEAIPELVEVLSNLITIHQTGGVYPPLKERADSWDKARAALAKLEAKS